MCDNVNDRPFTIPSCSPIYACMYAVRLYVCMYVCMSDDFFYSILINFYKMEIERSAKQYSVRTSTLDCSNRTILAC